jgi:hypothetical protein
MKKIILSMAYQSKDAAKNVTEFETAIQSYSRYM